MFFELSVFKKKVAVKNLRGYDTELILVPPRPRIVQSLYQDNYVIVDVVPVTFSSTRVSFM